MSKEIVFCLNTENSIDSFVFEQFDVLYSFRVSTKVELVSDLRKHQKLKIAFFVELYFAMIKE